MGFSDLGILRSSGRHYDHKGGAEDRVSTRWWCELRQRWACFGSSRTILPQRVEDVGWRRKGKFGVMLFHLHGTISC